MKQVISMILASSLTSLLFTIASVGAVTQSGSEISSVETEATINLNSILEQQQKLSQECRRLELSKMAQLKQVLALEQSLGLSDLLDQTNAIRIPAICLLLNGPPSSDASLNRAARPSSLRLDLVNWIFEPDELGLRSVMPNKTTPRKKRDLVATSSNNPAIDPGLLSNYLFDVNDLKESTNDVAASNGDGDDDEKKKFLKQYTSMLQDERYKSALEPISQRVAGYLSPVILIPGLAGSRLQARIKKQQRVNIICSKQSDWQDMWLSLRWFLPVAIDCWIDNARLVYDPVSGFAKNPPGVESRVPDFGSVASVRHLDIKSPKLTKYFDSIVERYLLLGYQDGKNLFAAPYDFRLAPQQLEETFFVDLKKLIDHANEQHQMSTSFLGAKSINKVTLVCHSMGCTNVLLFLRQQTPAWRQARIRKLVAISSPWGGATKALKGLLVGEQFGLPIVSETKLRTLARTLPAVAYLLPLAEVFDRPNKYQLEGGTTLVQTPQKSYKTKQLEQLLKDANLDLQLQWFKRTTENLKPLEPLPDVDVDCLHSLNIPTQETVIFRNQTDFPDGDYDLTFGDGDGTVNHQSLMVCADWASKLPGRVRHKIVKNTSHTGILHHQSVLDHIVQDVISNQSQDADNEIQ